ncbi:DUF7139 domain-containing protein [Natronomonas salsuginis]|uniref:Permease n=1 Tax=Natronomonas salsuginis TaxID=2217661 RepID=A0A4U5JFX8_9EURY|nr:permease [Natronomonas salsuginis]TKR27695.1 permease [Natronomonas salsuginis]
MASADTADRDRLVELYRTYIGEPDRRTDVYLGFTLFFGGLGLGLLGLFLFVLERAVLDGLVFWIREIAFAIGALGLPLILVAVVVLLPADRRALYIAVGGFAVVVISVGFFVTVYPSNWNYGTPDYSLHGVTVYAVGLISTLAATGSALVGYHVERVEGGPATAEGETGTAGGTAGSTGTDDPAATAAKVQQDIDEAMSETEVNWGGVEKVETERLRITPDENLDGESLNQESAKVHRSAGIDDQLSALRGMKGGEQRTDSGSGVDEQAAALQELREQKRREAEAEDSGLVDQVKSYFGK